MPFSRRDLIKVGLTSGGLLLAPVGEQKEALAQDAQTSCTGVASCPSPINKSRAASRTWSAFGNELPIPPLLESGSAGVITTYWAKIDGGWELIPSEADAEILEDEGIVVETVVCYELEMQKADVSIGGNTIRTWTYGGTIPGPFIRQQKGDESIVRFVNNLCTVDEDDLKTWVLNGGATNGYDADNGAPINTVIHLHGMASLPQYDGYADDFIPPGYYKDYHYPNDRAATIWYHDHVAGRTERNVGMGLVGMYTIEGQEENEANKQLPDDYGHDDIPIVIQANPGIVGTTSQYELIVNGELQPYLQIEHALYRFRVLNATSNYDGDVLRLAKSLDSNGKPQDFLQSPDGSCVFTVIGTDGGLIQRPGGAGPFPTTDGLPIGMGERYEILINFKQLANDHSDLGNELYLVFDPDGVLLKFDLSGLADITDTSGVTCGAPEIPPNAYRPFPKPEASSPQCPQDDPVTLTFQQDGVSIEGAKGVYTHRPGCFYEGPVDQAEPVTPTTGPMEFVIGDGNGFIKDDGSWDSRPEGKSWMAAEPMVPYPGGDNDPPPTVPPTSTTNFDDRIGNRVIPTPKLEHRQKWDLVNMTHYTHPVHIHLLDTLMLNRTIAISKTTTKTKYASTYTFECCDSNNDNCVSGNPEVTAVTCPVDKTKITGTPAAALVEKAFDAAMAADLGLNPQAILGKTYSELKALLTSEKPDSTKTTTYNLQRQKRLDAWNNLQIRTMDWSSDTFAPYDWEKNWKDVYMLHPGERIQIIGTFGPHLGRYMMHCHNLGHEDCDMMIEFEVTDASGNTGTGDSPFADPAKCFDGAGSDPLASKPPMYDLEDVREFNERFYGVGNYSKKYASKKLQDKVKKRAKQRAGVRSLKNLKGQKLQNLLDQQAEQAINSSIFLDLADLNPDRDATCNTDNPWAGLPTPPPIA